jgi:hypothetical protein
MLADIFAIFAIDGLPMLRRHYYDADAAIIYAADFLRCRQLIRQRHYFRHVS